jgi:hypothetical protein
MNTATTVTQATTETSTTDQALIRLRNIEKRYQTKACFSYVLRQINLDIAQGDFVTIMGPSGAGKSTLLGILGMYDHTWEGEFEFLGHQVHRLATRDRAMLNKRYVGFVFQQFHLLDDLTVAENLDIPLSYRNVPKSERQGMVADVLDRFGIVAKRICIQRNSPADSSNSSPSRAPSADEVSRLVLSNLQYDQTIPRMTERTLPEIQIARQESRSGECQQKGKYLLVGHALVPQFMADLTHGNLPASEQLALALQDVFVKDVHRPAVAQVSNLLYRGFPIRVPWEVSAFPTDRAGCRMEFGDTADWKSALQPCRLRSHLMGVFPKRLSRRAHRFGNRIFRDTAAPFLDDALPSHSVGDLLQDVRHENARTAKGRLPMTNLRIRDDVTPHDFFSHTAHITTPSRVTGQRSLRKSSFS